ncbi:MAG: OsmC family protein [Aquificae bacterium]|nr:OsmC family protein [Aquificota bacterium]
MEEKEVVLTLSEEATFRAELPSGSLTLGEKALKPMEVLLAALGSCSGVDVYHILRKKRQEPRDLKIVVKGKRREEHPRIYEEIEVRYVVRGKVEEKALKQAVELSVNKYCSVMAMLRPSAKIKVSWEVWED